jgi:hypothetical protein
MTGILLHKGGTSQYPDLEPGNLKGSERGHVAQRLVVVRCIRATLLDYGISRLPPCCACRSGAPPGMSASSKIERRCSTSGTGRSATVRRRTQVDPLLLVVLDRRGRSRTALNGHELPSSFLLKVAFGLRFLRSAGFRSARNRCAPIRARVAALRSWCAIERGHITLV